MVQNVLGGFSFYTLQKKLASVTEKQREIYAVCETTLGKRGGLLLQFLNHARESLKQMDEK